MTTAHDPNCAMRDGDNGPDATSKTALPARPAPCHRLMGNAGDWEEDGVACDEAKCGPRSWTRPPPGRLTSAGVRDRVTEQATPAAQRARHGCGRGVRLSSGGPPSCQELQARLFGVDGRDLDGLAVLEQRDV